jgi:hypothetical protein
VYHHQRWVLRRLVPISRAVQRAGRQQDPAATLASAAATPSEADTAPAGVAINSEGKVLEWGRRDAGLDRIAGRFSNTRPLILRYGSDVTDGIYLFVDSGQPEDVVCDARKLGVRADTLVFDEFAGRVLEAKHAEDALSFKTPEGPSVVQLASALTLAKGFLARIADELRLQLTQRALDRALGTRLPHKVWSRFCQAAQWDANVARTGKGSLAVAGGTYTATMPQWKYFNRQGAAQLVALNQTAPEPIVARAFSKARDVASSEEVVLDTPAARRRHFDAREGHAYAMHLYLDYQDGQWPEVHSVGFAPGTHDWEEKSIRVVPTRPVKTAMVLLEFHQPQGAAWFDDLSLSSGDRAERNLLAAPGFEEEDAAAVRAQAIGADYERQVQALLEAVEAAARSTTPATAIPGLARQVDDLTASVTDHGLTSYFPRELRDLQSAREKLELCARILAARR